MLHDSIRRPINGRLPFILRLNEIVVGDYLEVVWAETTSDKYAGGQYGLVYAINHKTRQAQIGRSGFWSSEGDVVRRHDKDGRRPCSHCGGSGSEPRT